MFEQSPGALELPRPKELERDDRRGLAGQRPLRQRPLERERLLHPLARNASPGAEMLEPVDRQRTAPERGVARA